MKDTRSGGVSESGRGREEVKGILFYFILV